MKQEQIDLINYRLEKAKLTLEEANHLFKGKYFNAVFHRAYYACFYAVTALLLTQNLSSSKHSGILSLFQKHFIRANLINEQLGKFYFRLFKNRQESDYRDFISFNEDEAEEVLLNSSEFIDSISKLIEADLNKLGNIT
ncbi:MAG: HEPN domain-containing protein [Ignavibacteria bacterium]|nr:HEPN domain-containing protein [Ignavibacteria bacterium]